MLDINLDEHKTSDKKIIINSKTIQLENNVYSTIKCYKSLTDIETLETKCLNIIKIHKTIYLNLPNLTAIDMRENRLCKISKNFKLFKNLESLRLDFNLITFIPSFISEFTQLKLFTISNNLITSIPASIQYLTSLQIFKFSNNKIDKLPIEFGQLKSLECLYLDGNYYTEIPTTLCYLRHLNEMSFEWVEFLEPPLYKNIKDSFGKPCINIIRDALQEMIKNSILYCDFLTFIDKISTKQNNDTVAASDKNSQNENNNNNNINNNNQSNSNLLNPIKKYKPQNKYMKILTAIENNYYGVVKSLLNTNDYEEYIKIKNEENKTSFYLTIHQKNEDLISLFLSKIELSNFPLTHIYLHKAIRMRNPELVKRLINMGVNVNTTDDQGSSPFHILFATFTKQLSKCALIGDFLLEKDCSVNTFNNDNWAPIHIAARRASKECLLWIISSNKRLRIENKEEFDLNLRGHNNWTPLHLTINSFRIEETLILLENGCDVFARNIDAKTPKRVSIGNYVFSKLLTNYENNMLEKRYCSDDDKMFVRCFTSVDDCDEDNMNFNNKNNNYVSRENNKNKKESFIKAKTNNFYNTINNNFNSHNENFKKSINTSSHLGINNNNFKKFSSSLNFNQVNQSISNSKSFKNSSVVSSIKNGNLYTNPPVSLERNIETSEFSNLTKLTPFREAESLNYLKDILLNNESSAYEKYEALKSIKLTKQDIRLLMKIIIDSLDLENEINLSIISDICNYALSNIMTDLIPILNQISRNTLLKGNKSYIKSEIENTILILENLKNNSILVKYQTTLINQEKLKELKRNNRMEKIGNDDNEMFYNSNGDSEEIEDNENDDFNFDEMSEMIKEKKDNIENNK